MPLRRAAVATLMPRFLLPLVALAYLSLGVGSNSLTALVAFGVLVSGFALLWRPGETPILLYGFVLQWIEASLSIFQANWQNRALSTLAIFGSDIELSTMLSLVGLLVLAIGMRVGAGRVYTAEVQLAWLTVRQRPPKIWFQFYCVTWIAASAAKSLALAVPELSQPLLALANLKWAGFFVFTFVTFARPSSSRALWMLAFLVELTLSLGGFFSSFKTVFLVTLLALFAAGAKMTPQRYLIAAALSGMLLYLGVLWTTVKPDYRDFVQQGARDQSVNVDFATRIEKLYDLVSEIDSERFYRATSELMDRAAYVQYFGMVLNNVPEVLPHEWGALWLDAITRPVTPRLLFPQKSVIDESALTSKYTGLRVAGFEEGTQISIGYMGETYIDFGEFGMMPALFALGVFFGTIYRWLMRSPKSRGVLGMGLASAILLQTLELGNSTAKLFGGLVVAILVSWLLTRFFVPRFLPWLLAPSSDFAH
jgi:hypothetical protein